ncbi:alpha/beta fold hydrolase [Nocardioides sp. zg-536]|uniref:Alpha/beta fold hydrolase n=1 Tax=Nocardioides faecalis TaxID=2803858 RepID=A0A939BR76_9ACTN|nr:alpha/beta fold hydrolase [Nocardioides faecalis]MBM9458334.1 alpha/beta fold hydrolase [Nocardioides faecalis]MBS4753365.1 alpha/beta fold hydrolase [Nocardioides faecalis]QVI58359.1 alpha/beta fold hydrolase [Nocardioides faecalis]
MTTDVSHEATRREVATELGTLRYHEAGHGEPLLLLHGSGPGVTGWQNYRGVLAELAQHRRCLVLEFPGFGVSDPVEGHPMVMAESAVGVFLDALGLGAVDIIGNSMGGIVAAKVAIAEPQRVRRLVTVGGIGRNVFSPNPSEGIKLLMEFTDEPSRERLVRWLHAMVHDPALVTEELIEERWRLATDPKTLEIARRMYSTKAFAATIAANAMGDAVPYWAQLHKLQAPTLVTWGRDDRVSPVDSALLAMRDLPDGELHVFPRCGHWTMIEAREAWLPTVIGFLTREDAR